mgnify:CR=1 FL=1
MQCFNCDDYDCIGGKFALNGNVSHLAVVHTSTMLARDPEVLNLMLPTLQQLMDIPDGIRNTPGLYALISLSEGGRGQSGAKGLVYRPPEVKGLGSIFGMYHLPPAPGQPTAVSADELVMGVDIDRVVTADMIATSDSQGNTRKLKVKEAMQHAWKGYRRYAYGSDELKPLSHRGHNNWGGMGVTLVDSLDTLWIMDMKAEFNEARDWVRDKLSFDLSGEKVFLDKANELGLKLLGAFDTATGKTRVVQMFYEFLYPYVYSIYVFRYTEIVLEYEKWYW